MNRNCPCRPGRLIFFLIFFVAYVIVCFFVTMVKKEKENSKTVVMPEAHVFLASADEENSAGSSGSVGTGGHGMATMEVSLNPVTK